MFIAKHVLQHMFQQQCAVFYRLCIYCETWANVIIYELQGKLWSV